MVFQKWFKIVVGQCLIVKYTYSSENKNHPKTGYHIILLFSGHNFL